MPQTFAERNNLLEIEVNTTKDTIWRLTNRVCVLESEFKRFKELLKRSVLKPSPDVQRATKRAKSAEMARRQKQQRVESNITGEEIVVKTEKIDSCDESSDSEAPMDDFMSDIETSEDDFHEFQGSRVSNNDNNYQEPESDFDDNDEDYRAQIRIKPPNELFGRRSSGRKKHEIWNNFKRMDVIAENGSKTSITICKRCKRAVSSRGYRLQKHLEKCTVVPKDPLDASLKVEGAKQVEVVANVNDEVNDNEEEEDSEANYETIAAEAVSLSPAKSGRKRTPIWRHYIRKPKPETPDRPNRKYAVIAVCKNCQAEVSAKAGRMKIHLQKCLTGQLINKPIGTFKREAVDTKVFVTPSKPMLLQMSPGQVETAVEMTDPIAAANCTSVIVDGANKVDNSANPENATPSTALSNCDNSDPVSDCDNVEFRNDVIEISVGSSTFLNPRHSSNSNKTSPVWQHYNITKEMKDGKICIVSAACKYCNKVVSAKSARLMLHLKKCQVTMAKK